MLKITLKQAASLSVPFLDTLPLNLDLVRVNKDTAVSREGLVVQRAVTEMVAD